MSASVTARNKRYPLNLRLSRNTLSQPAVRGAGTGMASNDLGGREHHWRGRPFVSSGQRLLLLGHVRLVTQELVHDAGADVDRRDGKHAEADPRRPVAAVILVEHGVDVDAEEDVEGAQVERRLAHHQVHDLPRAALEADAGVGTDGGVDGVEDCKGHDGDADAAVVEALAVRGEPAGRQTLADEDVGQRRNGQDNTSDLQHEVREIGLLAQHGDVLGHDGAEREQQHPRDGHEDAVRALRLVLDHHRGRQLGGNAGRQRGGQVSAARAVGVQGVAAGERPDEVSEALGLDGQRRGAEVHGEGEQRRAAAVGVASVGERSSCGLVWHDSANGARGQAVALHARGGADDSQGARHRVGVLGRLEADADPALCR
mmetsp:Transcript_2009/g.5243  ORF Transcript_2009/g.5243 Transcript_2009/m.5243 type:complete len:372 (-) Transcript_2009:1009-2124(-)